jgi:hypothetical protein
MTDAARWVLVMGLAALQVGKVAHARGPHPDHDGDNAGALRTGVQATVLATR